MCGRFTLRTLLAVLIEQFELDAQGDHQLPLLDARYYIAPTQEILVVRADANSGRRNASMLRWGLIPSWSKADDVGTGPPLINARSETLAENPRFAPHTESVAASSRPTVFSNGSNPPSARAARSNRSTSTAPTAPRSPSPASGNAKP